MIKSDSANYLFHSLIKYDITYIQEYYLKIGKLFWTYNLLVERISQPHTNLVT